MLKIEYVLELLNNTELKKDFSSIVSCVKTRIDQGRVKSIDIDYQEFSTKAFLHIFKIRLSHARDINLPIEGLEKSIEKIEKYKGNLIMGGIETDEEYFDIFFSVRIDKIIGISKISKIENGCSGS